jgi:hypothetical protein
MPLVTGDFVWIFDDDDVALPSSIADRVDAFRPDIGVVFSKHYWGSSSPSGRVVQGDPIDWPSLDEGSIALTLMRGCFTTLQGALVRTECYRSVGPFREDLLRSQDYDMLIRLARGCRVGLLPRPTFIFRRHEGQRGAAAARHAAGEREAIWAHYDAMVGRWLRRDATLGEFLAPAIKGPLTPQQERAATLNRLTVMASKGVADSMIEDAVQFATCMQLTQPGQLDAEERRALVGATQQKYFLLNTLPDPSAFIDKARVLARTPSGRVLLRVFARGLVGIAWWGLRGRRERGRALWLAARLFALSIGHSTRREGLGAST